MLLADPCVAGDHLAARQQLQLPTARRLHKHPLPIQRRINRRRLTSQRHSTRSRRIPLRGGSRQSGEPCLCAERHRSSAYRWRLVCYTRYTRQHGLAPFSFSTHDTTARRIPCCIVPANARVCPKLMPINAVQASSSGSRWLIWFQPQV
jgi:hypothetical protein